MVLQSVQVQDLLPHVHLLLLVMYFCLRYTFVLSIPSCSLFCSNCYRQSFAFFHAVVLLVANDSLLYISRYRVD